MKDENIQMKCRIGGGALWQGPHAQDPPMTRGRGYVLMGHPPMRIMGRFFIWEILNMPGWGGKEGGEESSLL